MITPKVYKQATSGPCASYTMLVCCQRLGIDVSEEYMLATKEIGLQSVAQTLISDKKISNFLVISTAEGVDFWLKKGHYIAAGTGKMDFDAVRHTPYINPFLGDKGHNFAIIADMGDMWKVQDSQGESFADKGCWYMKKSDFRQIKKFRIYV